MASQASKKSAQERRAQIEKLRVDQARRERRRKINFGIGAGVLVAALVGGLIALSLSKKSSGTPATDTADQTTNALAQTWDGLTGQTVNGVSAQTNEQLKYHIHSHLAIYVNGKQKAVPAGIGIVKPWTTEPLNGGIFVDGGKQLYYLHTHDATGVLHVESPTSNTYTLGQIFAEWHQPLSTSEVGPATGTVIAYVNGQKYTGDPSNIPLTAHAVIQLDVGTDVSPVPFTFASGL